MFSKPPTAPRCASSPRPRRRSARAAKSGFICRRTAAGHWSDNKKAEDAMERRLSRRDLLKGSPALGLGPVFAPPARAEAPPPVAITPALVEAAKKEGKIVLYSSMDLPVGEKLG